MNSYRAHQNALISEILQTIENYGREHGSTLDRAELF